MTEKTKLELPGRRLWWTLAAGAVVLVVIAAVAQLVGLVPQWANPFAEREVDRSQPVLLERIRDLSRYEAASGEFQVIIDIETDAPFIPSSVLGERTLFVAAGSVDAYVEFSGLSKGAITVSSDGQRATVRLPHARLEPVNLDHKRSYVYARERGVLNRVGELLSDNPRSEQRLYQLAEAKIGTAAARSKLTAQAETNTRAMLVGMLGQLGYRSVTVEFGKSPS
ncbi:MAG: DUF4230 domain-containing protein [Micromonosporaceae bacterium]